MGQKVRERSAGWKLPLKQKKEALRTGTRSQARKEGREGLIARGHRKAGNQVRTVSEDKGTEEGPADACSGRVKGRGGQVGMVVERAAGGFKTHEDCVQRGEQREAAKRREIQKSMGPGSTVRGAGGVMVRARGWAGRSGGSSHLWTLVAPVVCVCACVSHSVVSNCATPWTVAHQAPLSVGFSRREYWSG